MIGGLAEQRLGGIDEAREAGQHTQVIIREGGPDNHLLGITRAIGHGTQPPANGRIGQAALAQRRNLKGIEETRQEHESVAFKQRDVAGFERPSGRHCAILVGRRRRGRYHGHPRDVLRWDYARRVRAPLSISWALAPPPWARRCRASARRTGLRVYAACRDRSPQRYSRW